MDLSDKNMKISKLDQYLVNYKKQFTNKLID